MPKFKVHFVSHHAIGWVKSIEASNQSDAEDIANGEDPEIDEGWEQEWEDTEYGIDWVEPVKETDGN